ncbi:MAG: DNA adenine methylase [Deltaproteobacteria bacterium]|jgi:DNA adenine methylase|nr:DNA adenine methylase [Deltaproteobacteria bacterium]
MDYIDETRAAVEWKTTREQVVNWCARALVPGAELSEGRWKIPSPSPRPLQEDLVTHKAVPMAKPFLKWAGGKTQILDQIRARYPEGLGRRLDRYAEPFVGSGAVLFDVLNRYDLKEIYIGDINRELITCYEMVRDRVDDVVTTLEKIEKDYLPGSIAERKLFYAEARNRFNQLKKEASHGTELAALFIFLNHTCFNGLYRVNSDGEFNVPMGSYRNPTICDGRNLRAVSQALAGVTITCAEYPKSMDFINSECFVYIDPPYRPLSSTSSFTSYDQYAFGDDQQASLARFVDAIVDKGAYVLVSNSDPKNTSPTDDFFDELYVKHAIERIKAVRVINSVASGRGAITELLIIGNKLAQL